MNSTKFFAADGGGRAKTFGVLFLPSPPRGEESQALPAPGKRATLVLVKIENGG